jgi:hypothetical protein
LEKVNLIPKDAEKSTSPSRLQSTAPPRIPFVDQERKGERKGDTHLSFNYQKR